MPESFATPLNRHQIGLAADILTGAFHNSPLIAYMFPDAAVREKRLRWYFRASVRYAVTCGECHLAPSHDGVALWLPPLHPLRDIWGILRSGMIAAPYVLGRVGYGRMLEVAGLIRQYRANHAPPGHWYLSELAVLPSKQQTGIGTGLVKPMLERFDKENCVCYVETSNEDAVMFYERLGFRVAGSYEMPFDTLACHCLVRHARQHGGDVAN